jgi:two-component system cell cycle response regulator
MDGDTLVIRLPENCSPAVLGELAQYLQTKLADAVDSGFGKVIFDLHAVKALHMGIIKTLLQAMQACRELALQFALAANGEIVAECKEFEDTRGWTFYESFDEAKANLGKAVAAV